MPQTGSNRKKRETESEYGMGCSVIEVSSFYETRKSRCLPLHLRTETDPFSETLCFLVFRLFLIDKVRKPSNSDCYYRFIIVKSYILYIIRRYVGFLAV
jgi:hypothetical protein